jgi:hypothetical protein
VIGPENGDEVDAPPSRGGDAKPRGENACTLKLPLPGRSKMPPLVCMEEASDCREGLEQG